MSTINELPRVNRWLKTILSADATLSSAVGGRFFEGHVPEGQSFPACVFTILATQDLYVAGRQERLWASVTALVKVVAETNTDATLQGAADRIDAVLHDASGGVSDCEIVECVRRSGFRMKDTTVANKVYLHLGGQYEIKIRYVG